MEEPSSITGVIAAEGGRVTFARFAEIALTHPTLGYYSRAERLLGPGGDFSTAPALSPFFCRTLARLITELVQSGLDADAETGPAAGQAGTAASAPRGAGGLSVVELGGGEGHLAAAVLRRWQHERPEWRDRVAYRIVEVGSGLRRRQAAAVRALVAAGWEVAWGGDLEEACAGTRPLVIFGNEFLDALPVHSVDVRGRVLLEAYVEAAPAGLRQTWSDISPAAAAEIELLFGISDPVRLQPLTQDGVLEVRPALKDLFGQVGHLMPAGSFVTVDYGEWHRGLSCPAEATLSFAAAECSLQARATRRRTVRGYFKHGLTPAVLARPGRQDLTADLDFAALDLHGGRAGFETVVFTTLSAFLRGGGAEKELRSLRSALESGEIRSLESPPPVIGGAGAGRSPDASSPATPSPADPLEADRQATVLEHLLDERDLGGALKVMVQVRG